MLLLFHHICSHCHDRLDGLLVGLALGVVLALVHLVAQGILGSGGTVKEELLVDILWIEYMKGLTECQRRHRSPWRPACWPPSQCHWWPAGPSRKRSWRPA